MSKLRPESWACPGDTVNTIAMDATQQIVATDTTRLDGVRVIGVDEHRWSHTRRCDQDGYVTVIVDLTPVLGRDRAGQAARPGPRTLCCSLEDLAERSERGVP